MTGMVLIGGPVGLMIPKAELFPDVDRAIGNLPDPLPVPPSVALSGPNERVPLMAEIGRLLLPEVWFARDPARDPEGCMIFEGKTVFVRRYPVKEAMVLFAGRDIAPVPCEGGRLDLSLAFGTGRFDIVVFANGLPLKVTDIPTELVRLPGTTSVAPEEREKPPPVARYVILGEAGAKLRVVLGM